MTYTVLARRYRPKTFSDLLGQESVVRALQNGLTEGRIAHAFLFTGARGVGKTSAARLLAKALNCEQGPAAEPCNVCDSCTAIARGQDVDVFEIDGASNNSVEDVRRLQDGLPFRPSHRRFKVYIVDEVHMLSSGAFNAFLKTLEEPPDHVKFIFATTEIHKVPITVRSRCQRYDFRLIDRDVIAEHLAAVLTTESIAFEPEACQRIAHEAAGSLRDALTLLDQVRAFTPESLSASAVDLALGLAPRAALQDALRGLAAHDPARVLGALEQAEQSGAPTAVFLRQLLEALRDLALGASLGAADGRPTMLTVAEVVELLPHFEPSASLDLQRLFALLSAGFDRLSHSRFPKLHLELTLLRASERTHLGAISTLIERVAALEAATTGGGTPGAGYAGGGAGGGTGVRGSRSERSTSSAPKPEQTTANNAPAAVMNSARDEEASPVAVSPAAVAPAAVLPAAVLPAAVPPALEGRPALPDVGHPAIDESLSDGPAAPTNAHLLAEASSARTSPAPQKASGYLGDATDAAATSQAAPHAHAAKPHLPAETNGSRGAASTSATPAVALTSPVLWERVLESLRVTRPALAAVLEHAIPERIEAQSVTLRFAEGSFFAEQARAKSAQLDLSAVLETLVGARPRIEIVTGATPPGQKTYVEAREAYLSEARTHLEAQALSHPAVQAALNAFPEARSRARVRVDAAALTRASEAARAAGSDTPATTPSGSDAPTTSEGSADIAGDVVAGSTVASRAPRDSKPAQVAEAYQP